MIALTDTDTSLPTNMTEVPAWLRARYDEHASVYDIAVYGRPETWLAIAEVLSCASQSTGAGDAISLTDPAVIIAGIRQFGLAPDGSDLRDLERAIDRHAAAPATPAGESTMDWSDIFMGVIIFLGICWVFNTRL